MEKIIISVATTNSALKADLREPTVKAFKHSGRGLIAAVKWAKDQAASLKMAQGNLSYPRVTITINGAACDFDWIALDLAGDTTVKNAEAILKANYEI